MLLHHKKEVRYCFRSSKTGSPSHVRIAECIVPTGSFFMLKHLSHSTLEKSFHQSEDEPVSREAMRHQDARAYY